MTTSIDFEDPYDGLCNQLEEANDDFNDDTFGGVLAAGTAALERRQGPQASPGQAAP